MSAISQVQLQRGTSAADWAAPIPGLEVDKTRTLAVTHVVKMLQKMTPEDGYLRTPEIFRSWAESTGL